MTHRIKYGSILVLIAGIFLLLSDHYLQSFFFVENFEEINNLSTLLNQESNLL